MSVVGGAWRRVGNKPECTRAGVTDEVISRPGRAGPDWTGPDRTGPDRIGSDRAGPGRAGRALVWFNRLAGRHTGVMLSLIHI